MRRFAYYVRDAAAPPEPDAPTAARVWCIAGAPNRESLCGARAKGHAWPHTERVLPEGDTLCIACAAALEELP